MFLKKKLGLSEFFPKKLTTSVKTQCFLGKNSLTLCQNVTMKPNPVAEDICKFNVNPLYLNKLFISFQPYLIYLDEMSIVLP